MRLEGAISCVMVRQLQPDDTLEEYPGLLELCLPELQLGRMGGTCEEFPGSTGTRWLQLPVVHGPGRRGECMGCSVPEYWGKEVRQEYKRMTVDRCSTQEQGYALI